MFSLAQEGVMEHINFPVQETWVHLNLQLVVCCIVMKLGTFCKIFMKLRYTFPEIYESHH